MADEAEFSAPSQEKTMRQLTALVAALALLSFAGVRAAPAATGDTYKVKKAECKKRADTMNFGVHLIKKNRWVKDCIAGKIA
jgi:outer membrane lipoprotein SlyB